MRRAYMASRALMNISAKNQFKPIEISEMKPLRLKIRNICGDETIWEV